MPGSSTLALILLKSNIIYLEVNDMDKDKLLLNQKASINFILFRIVVITILIVALTVSKFFFGDSFKAINEFYKNNISINITADYFDNIGGE